MENAYSLYQILFPNGKRYFGITSNPRRRWNEHKRAAERQNQRPVYRAIRKYHPENIVFSILAVGQEGYIAELEIKAIATFDAQKNGYNVSLGGELSPMLTEVTRKKQSATLTGFKHTDEARENMRLSQIGRKHSAETKAKIGAIHKGKKISADQVKAMIDGRKPITEETRAKLSKARKGTIFTVEHREKISASNRATMSTPEYKAKRSAASKAMQTPEMKVKKSAAVRAAFQRPEVRARHAAAMAARNISRLQSTANRSK